MKDKNKKYVRFRHRVVIRFLRIFVGPIINLIYNVHYENKYHMKKDEQFFIISNHQTDLDPAFVTMGFTKPMYYVSTDTITTSPFYPIVKYGIDPIPKKKGLQDISTIKKMMQVAKEGGTICLFPEGNRSYGEFQFTVEASLSKLIKRLKLPLALYNIKGGYGKSPRFASKKRHGRIDCSIKRIIYPEEYMKMSDEELLRCIMDSIRVYDSESGIKYPSKRRAEYLERELFVCPVCGKKETLHSKGDYVTCDSCGLNVEYTEDLHFKSDNEGFKFTIMNEWYEYEKKWTREYAVKEDEIIFSDKEVELYTSTPGVRRKLIDKGDMILMDKTLKIGKTTVFSVSDIVISSPVSGRKLALTVGDKSYMLRGNERFNPLKYAFMFNRLDTKMKQDKTDIYYSIEERK